MEKITTVCYGHSKWFAFYSSLKGGKITIIYSNLQFGSPFFNLLSTPLPITIHPCMFYSHLLNIWLANVPNVYKSEQNCPKGLIQEIAKK